MSKQQRAPMYMRVGSEAQLNNKLNNIHMRIVAEEQNMKELAIQFLASSEKYNELRNTQRSLTAQLFSLKRNRSVSEKRG